MKEVEYIIMLVGCIMVFFTIILMANDISDLHKQIERLEKRTIILETKFEMRGFA
jgi:Na+/pantothenate symporter